MVEDTTDESLLDTTATRIVRETIRDALADDCDHGFDVPVDAGVYLGFTPASGGPHDVLGHLYVYVADLTHHQRTDDLGRPYADTEEIYNQSKTLNVLANELRQLLYDEVECDHTFTRGATEEPGGGVCYATTVTAAASVRDSPRLPDDEL